MGARLYWRLFALGVASSLSWFFTSCGSSGGSAASSTGAVESAEIPGETDVVSSVAAMEKGDIVLLTFSGGSTSLSFSGAASGSEYTLIAQSAQTTSGSSSLTLGDESAALSTGLGKAVFGSYDGDVQSEFETFLRTSESQMIEAGEEPAEESATIYKSVAKAVTAGTSSTFRVLSSLYSVSSYNEVTATAKCVNSRVAIFADNAIDTNLSGVMTSSDYDTLCSQFKTALDTEFSIIGEPPDINSDESVTVLMTPQINSLGASGGGIVTGFFFAGDLLTRSASNSASNEREIVFVLTPDPDGRFGAKISKEFAMSNLLTAVVPHELQHLLSYYYHVISKKGSAETTWLNEGMSHLIEDVVGYGQENPSRVALYLESTNESPLIPSSSPDLSERGGLYLFMRFMYEQAGTSGNAFLQSLVQTTQVGANNIIAAFGTSRSEFNEFSEFMRRWGVAVAATNAGVTSDSRYIYGARTWNSTTSRWQGMCLICDAEDGRSTTLSGPTKTTYSSGQSLTLRSASSAFFSFSSIPSAISLSASDSASPQGILLRTK